MAAKKKPKRGWVRDWRYCKPFSAPGKSTTPAMGQERFKMHEVPGSPGLKVGTLVETPYMRLSRLAAEERSRSDACRAAEIVCRCEIQSRNPLARTVYIARIHEPDDVTIHSILETSTCQDPNKWQEDPTMSTRQVCDMPLCALQDLFDKLVAAGAIVSLGGAQ